MPTENEVSNHFMFPASNPKRNHIIEIPCLLEKESITRKREVTIATSEI